MPATHEVFNQPTALENYNLFTSDPILKKSVIREGASWAEERLAKLGSTVGTREYLQNAVWANEFSPKLRIHDRFGHRIDEVEYHPAWHELMRISVENSLHNLPWREKKSGAHVARAASVFLVLQSEQGHVCPISMTYSVVPSLRHQSDVAKGWEEKLQSNIYDPRFLPMEEKKGVLFGMAMTEKQGGSDVRANTTRAVALGKGGPGEAYHITGHKWFCSSPMCDAFLILAKTEKGLSCFLVPRWIPGTPEKKKNVFMIQRLKDKLGNKSNASSEIEFENTWGVMVGEEGRGVATIIEMVSHTRLDCAIAGAGLIRQGLVQAMHHAKNRSAFGKKLVDQILMKNVLADLALESQAATLLVMRLARAFDHRENDQGFEAPFQRLATAFSKYWLCKRAPSNVVEALECLGGMGYVEESMMPRLFRESPLYSIWEGSGNVNALDLLRAMQREPACVQAVMKEISEARGGHSEFDRYVKKLEDDLRTSENHEVNARRISEKMALSLQASLMIRFATKESSDAFCQSRLGGDWGHVFGTLPAGTAFDKILNETGLL